MFFMFYYEAVVYPLISPVVKPVRPVKKVERKLSDNQEDTSRKSKSATELPKVDLDIFFSFLGSRPENKFSSF